MKHSIKNWFERIPINLRAAAGLLGLLFVFYPDLFLVRAAPLTGDHLEQHYPWAYMLAQSIRHFKLPFWTDLIHCGFPLVAESQVGAFYLPNLLMYFYLPFHAAYSYMNLVHWFIAGFGTYLYAKKMKLGAMPAFVAAIIFTFGSAYGGAYYNMTSLKTICWFPVALYLLERYLEGYKSRWLFGLAVVVGQSMVAGYVQMAAFTWIIFAVYAVLRVLFFPDSSGGWIFRIVLLGRLVLSAVGAVGLALPQLFLTYQLAILSNRTGLEEGYAYVGSMAPYILGTLFNPHLSLLATGNNLYAGYFSIFLVLIALFCREYRGTPFFRIWVTMVLVALLMALGRWSPLYVALVKLTRFYSFRVPSKFLGFFCFGVAMLAALGFRILWNGGVRSRVTKLALITLVMVSLAVFGGMTAGTVLLSRGRQFVLGLGEAYVKRFVYGQPGHPHTLERYLSTVSEFPDRILKFLSWNEPANIGAVITALFCLLVILIIVRKKYSRPVMLFGILFLVADLYGAAFFDIRGDLAAYKSALVSSPIVEILKKEKAAGNLGRVYGCRAPSQRLPLVPSQNMLYGIADIGAYSPLVMSRYYETIGCLGNINDSTLAVTPAPAFVTRRLPLLDFLNVSHILSTVSLNHPNLELIFEDPLMSAYLYETGNSHKEAYFVTEVRFFEGWEPLKAELLNEGFDPANTLLLEREGSNSFSGISRRGNAQSALIEKKVARVGFSSWELICSSPGFFVLPNLHFPGWKAEVNGEEVLILKAYGVFQAVRINAAGRYTVEFLYPTFYERKFI